MLFEKKSHAAQSKDVNSDECSPALIDDCSAINERRRQWKNGSRHHSVGLENGELEPVKSSSPLFYDSIAGCEDVDVTRQLHDEEIVEQEIPDGGWGWVVVGASFLAHMIADGCGFSFGVLFGELLEVFKESKSRTAWVGSLFVSIPAVCGPIAGALTTRYGCRNTTIAGGVIAGLGCLASAYVTTIDQLCVTFGIIAGFGLSLVFVPSVIVVAFYFEKKRALATGIAAAGSGIGTFVFAPLTEWLLEHFLWRGTLIITAGILLNIVVCGALYRPLPKTRNGKQNISNNSQTSVDAHNSHGHCYSALTSPADDTGARTKTSRSYTNLSYSPGGTRPDESDMTSVYPEVHSLQLKLQLGGSRSHPHLEMMSNVPSDPDVDVDDDMLVPYKPCATSISCENPMIAQTRREISQTGRKTEVGTTKPIRVIHSAITISSSARPPTTTNVEAHSDHVQLSGGKRSQSLHTCFNSAGNAAASMTSVGVQLRRRDLVHRGSLISTGILLQQAAAAASRRSSCPETTFNRDQLRAFAQMKSSATSGQCGRQKLSLSVQEEVEDETDGKDDDVVQQRRMSSPIDDVTGNVNQQQCRRNSTAPVDLSVFGSAVFNLFCIHTVLLYVSYDIPYVYGPVRAENHGLTEQQASLLVSIIGIFNTVGQVAMGYVGDQSQIDTLVFYNVMTSIAGLAIIVVPAVTSFSALAVFNAAFGFFISANFSLTTVILVELVGVDRLTDAYGIVSLAQGVANLVGPPLAGWMSDNTGSYDLAFYCSGALTFLSGLMLFAAPSLRRFDFIPSRRSRQASISASSSSPASAVPAAASTASTDKKKFDCKQRPLVDIVVTSDAETGRVLATNTMQYSSID